MKTKYALLSVFDKTGIVPFARLLHKKGYVLISTGGTAKTLQNAKIPVVPITQITGNPECFDGRMKTISFQIESGILFDRSKKTHVQKAQELGIKPIDVVVCNLYPFEQTINKPDATLNDAIENIDVGGPTMIRAAAKNFKHVLVVVDPLDYERAFDVLKKSDLKIQQEFAAKAFFHLSLYDSQIARYFSTDDFPTEITIPGRKTLDLRYGENPHQKGAFYTIPNSTSPLAQLQKQAGRDLSLINITDINAGIEAVRLFKKPAAVIIKHNSPCGIALGGTPEQALARAIESDPESAFGGVVVLNTTFTKKAAHIIAAFKDERRSNIDIVAVPQAEDSAIDMLKGIRKTMGIYTFGKLIKESALNSKWIDGGFVLQTADNEIEKSFGQWNVVSKKKPNPQQLAQMKIAWQFISRIPSNAVIVVDEKLPMTRGIGSRQTSRVRSTRLALQQAGSFAKNAILASDSFFPFDDSVRISGKHGIAAIVQQGDSINDALSIKAADELGIVMIFTHRRAFWH